MDRVKLGIFNSTPNLHKLVKYGLDVIESTSSYKRNIDIKLIDIYCNNNVDNCDLIIVNICYKDMLTNTDIINNFNDLIENNFNGFNNLIIIITHDKYIIKDEFFSNFNSKIESILSKYPILLTHVYLDKAIEYLSVIRDDLKSVDMNIIDNILKDELGKQKYKLLDNDEKKFKEINNLIKNENIVEEWMSSVWFNKLLDVFETKIIIPYNNIIHKHCKSSVDEINNVISIISTNDITVSTQEQITLIFEIIEKLLITLDTFNTHHTTNNDMIDNIENEYIEQIKLLTEIEQERIINNINKHLIEVSTNFNVIEIFGYDFLEKYLDLIKKYAYSFKIDDEKINLIILDLMKSKMMHKFNEELFNELSLLNIKQNENKDNLENIFLECVGVWIKNDPNNFFELIKYSKKINQNSQTKLVITKFIEHMELLANNNLDKNNLLNEPIYNVDSSKLIEVFKIILDSQDVMSKEHMFNHNTIQISKLMYIITNIVLNDHQSLNSFIKQTVYIFDKYICDFVNYNDKKHNLFIHNIYYNYSNIVNSNNKISNELIDFDKFQKIHNVFKQILKILFDFVGYNQVFADKIVPPNNTTSDNNIQTNKVISSDSESEKESNSNSDSDNNSDSDVDSTESDNYLSEDEQIDKIYRFIKKTMSGKYLNQQTLKNISSIYWNKTRDYNRSIKLFESDVINKKFTKIYKENNKTK